MSHIRRVTKSDKNLSVIENILRSFWNSEAAAIFIVHRRYSNIFSCLCMSKTGVTEIERVRRFEKMNESSLYKSIKDHDEFNILYILSRIEYMQAMRKE